MHYFSMFISTYPREQNSKDGHEAHCRVAVLAVPAVISVQVTSGKFSKLVPRRVSKTPEGAVDDLVGAVGRAVA